MSSNINITNNGPTQQQFGDNNTQTMNVSGCEQVDLINQLQTVFNKSLADAPTDEYKVSAASPVETPDSVFSQLKEAAAPGASETVVETATSKWKALLAAYGPTVKKACLAFAETALTKYAENNPLIAGVVAALKTLES